MLERTNFIRDGRAPVPKRVETSMMMSRIKSKNTKPELILRKFLRASGVTGCRYNMEGVPGRPDICVPRKKIAIFVHGCFWHACPDCSKPLPKSNTAFWQTKFSMNKLRDKRKVRLLRSLGWRVITVWECQCGNISKLKSRLGGIL